MDDIQTITLMTVDEKVYEVPKEIINMFSNLLSIINGKKYRNIIFILEINLNELININTNSVELELIFLYCKYHNYIMPPEITKPLKSNNLFDLVTDQWDAEFINSLNYNQVANLLSASDILNCSSLTDLCYARLALYFRSIVKLINIRFFYE
jgi:hypothetical protein